MKRCKGSGRIYQTEEFRVEGHQHPLLEELVKELSIVLTDGKAEVPLVADWAQVRLECKNECIEECVVYVDVAHFFDYIIFMGIVIVVCGLFVALMTRWSTQLKKKLS